MRFADTIPGRGTIPRRRGRAWICPIPIRRRCPGASRPSEKLAIAHGVNRPAAPGNETLRSSTSRSAAPLMSALVEDVAQAVAQEIETEADDEDGKPRDGRHPPLIEDDIARRDHCTPFGVAAGRQVRESPAAAVRMMPAMSRVSPTISEERQSGTIWRTGWRTVDAPCITTAAMKSLRAIVTVSARGECGHRAARR